MKIDWYIDIQNSLPHIRRTKIEQTYDAITELNGDANPTHASDTVSPCLTSTVVSYKFCGFVLTQTDKNIIEDPSTVVYDTRMACDPTKNRSEARTRDCISSDLEFFFDHLRLEVIDVVGLKFLA